MKKKIVIVLILAVVIIGAFFAWKKYKNYKAGKEETMSVYEALVMVADQTASNPEEDARSSLKRGDVIAIFPEGHPWSDTERASYLIVKIKTTQENAQKLLEPVTKTVETRHAASNPDDKAAPADAKAMAGEVETVRPRKYHLDIDVPTVNDLMTKGQPYKDKIFGEGVIEER
jgi:hypothetical protein